MSLSRLVHLCLATMLGISIAGQLSAQSSSSKHAKQSSTTGTTAVDNGAVSNGTYRNKALALACKIPAGWVLRTEEMNSPDDESVEQKASPQASQKNTGEQRVLLAAFSRPPEARGEDINSSILIAEEPASSYPGLKEAAQYFWPLTEVATAQGFTVDEEPYEYSVGAKKMVRGDFHKDVGTRVMRQSTLAFLSHGYAVSITILGGTEEEVEELIDGISFGGK
jgi:hypothetical protein